MFYRHSPELVTGSINEDDSFCRTFLCLSGHSVLPASPSWLSLDHGGSGTDPASCAFSLQPVPPMFVPVAFLERSPNLDLTCSAFRVARQAAGASVAPGQPRPHHCSERGVAGPVFVFCTVALRAETDVLPPPCLWFRSTRPGSVWFPGESQSPRANARF